MPMTKPKTDTYKTGYVAKWVGQHENTVRDWSLRYKDLLSKGANAGRRRYVYTDVETLATIADYRQQGISLDDIEGLLKQGKRIETLPPEPTPDDIEARRNVQIVHIPETERLLEIQKYELQIQQLANERDTILDKLEDTEHERDSLLSKVSELDKELSVAQSQLESERKAHKAQIDIIQKERPSALFWLAVMLGVVVAVSFIIAGITLFFT